MGVKPGGGTGLNGPSADSPGCEQKRQATRCRLPLSRFAGRLSYFCQTFDLKSLSACLSWFSTSSVSSPVCDNVWRSWEAEVST